MPHKISRIPKSARKMALFGRVWPLTVINGYRLRLAMALAVLLAGGCEDVCDNEITQSTLSPSGKWKVVIFSRDCGATTGFNTQISILPASEELPGGSGNVLIFDDSLPLSVRWESESELTIKGALTSDIFKQEGIVAGVHINYAN